MKRIFTLFQEKIAIRMISLILVVIFIVGGAAVVLISEQMQQQEVASATILGETVLGAIDNALNTWITDQISMISMIASNEQIVAACLDPQDEANITNASNYLKKFYNSYGYYENFPIAAKFSESDNFKIQVDGQPVNIVSGSFFIDTVDGKTLGKGSDKDYIAATFSGAEHYISVVYPSILRGNPIFVIAEPVRSGNKVVGSAIVAPQMDYFTKIFVQDQQLGDTGYLMFFDDRGMLIAHPDAENILNQESVSVFSPITSRVIAGETAFFAKSPDGEERFYIGRKITVPTENIENSWFVVASIAASEVYQGSRSFALRVGIAAVGLFLVMIVLVLLIINRMVVNPLQKLVIAADRIAVGEINQTVEIKQKDEIGALAGSFQKMIGYFQKMANATNQMALGDFSQEIEAFSEDDVLGVSYHKMLINLRQMIGQVFESATRLDTASAHLASSAQLAGEATNQIARTIQDIAKGIGEQTESAGRTADSATQMDRAIEGVARGAQEQANAVNQAASLTAKISEAIQTVAQGAQNSALGAEEAASTAREGADIVEQTILGMQTIKNTVGLSAEKVREMGQHSSEIGAIVETIGDIAAQTNLLALNAAIEAARAGEHGKGFAVVADEVRKLAERAALASDEITDLIKNIQRSVDAAVVAMEESASEVEKGVSRAGQSSDALDSILKSAEAVRKQVEEIAESAQAIKGSSNDLVQAMTAVSAVVEENTAATEEMSASSSAMTQTVEAIVSVSEENSAAVEEVSASTEEMTAQVEEVTASTQALSEMASKLKQIVDVFKI